MLVLSRYKDESIMINDDVEIMVIKVQGNKVMLGITAPRHIAVNRKEIYLKIQEEKEWGSICREQPSDASNKCK